MKKKYCLSLLLLLLGLVAQAQTFYEMSFNMPNDDETFLGLIIYTDESDCKMRLVSARSIAENTVYEANYTCQIEHKKDAEDIGVMCYTPTEEGMPSLIWYWEKNDLSDLSDTPFIAFDLNDTESWFAATSFEEVSLANMDEEYVSQFYSANEPEYQMLMGAADVIRSQASAPLTFGGNDSPYGETDSPTPTDQAPAFHLIIAANTMVSDIGPACQIDFNNVRSEFAGVAKCLGMRLDEALVVGNNYSKDALFTAMDNLHPGSDDVVMFVYTGHGFRFKDQPDAYPNMDLTSTAYEDPTESYASLSDVFKTITSKGARLNIVLSDCCNSEVNLTQPIISSNSLFSRSNTSFDRNKVQQLFLRSQGNIIATAASPGEVAWCGSNGGFFLLSVIESLRNQISVMRNTPPSWEALIKNAIDAAAKKSESSEGCKKQNGVKYVEIKR